MQKISSYLYPNKINVVADVAVFPTRWNIVYQNRVKIYKGVDNLLTIDVKNADQKRIDISAMTLKLSVTDVNNKELGTFDVIPSATTGLATVNIPSMVLDYVSPQFLKFTIYKLNDDNSKTVFYADTQFGAIGNMELLGDVVPKKNSLRYITRFLEQTNTQVQPYLTETYSDAAEITQTNYLKNATLDAIILTFFCKNLDADITIQVTKDTVVSAGTIWEDIETFNVNFTVTTIGKTYFYPDYVREYNWARIKYRKLNNSTGKIEKVIISFDDLEELILDGGDA